MHGTRGPIADSRKFRLKYSAPCEFEIECEMGVATTQQIIGLLMQVPECNRHHRQIVVDPFCGNRNKKQCRRRLDGNEQQLALAPLLCKL